MLQTLLLTGPEEIGGTKIDKIMERIIQAGLWKSKALNEVDGKESGTAFIFTTQYSLV